MRNTKSSAIFNIITLILNNHSINSLKEKKFAEVFAKFCLHEKRMDWHCSSSKMLGISSDGNTLENHNNTGQLAQCTIFNCAHKKLLFFCNGLKETLTKSQLNQSPKIFLKNSMPLLLCTNSTNILEFEKNHSSIAYNSDSPITKELLSNYQMMFNYCIAPVIKLYEEEKIKIVDYVDNENENDGIYLVSTIKEEKIKRRNRRKNNVLEMIVGNLLNDKKPNLESAKILMEEINVFEVVVIKNGDAAKDFNELTKKHLLKKEKKSKSN